MTAEAIADPLLRAEKLVKIKATGGGGRLLGILGRSSWLSSSFWVILIRACVFATEASGSALGRRRAALHEGHRSLKKQEHDVPSWPRSYLYRAYLLGILRSITTSAVTAFCEFQFEDLKAKQVCALCVQGLQELAWCGPIINKRSGTLRTMMRTRALELHRSDALRPCLRSLSEFPRTFCRKPGRISGVISARA